MHSETDCRNVEACLLEAGMIPGTDFLEVGLTTSGQVYVRQWMHHREPEHHVIIHQAMVLCGLTEQTYEQWSGTEVPPDEEGHPIGETTTARRLRAH